MKTNAKRILSLLTAALLMFGVIPACAEWASFDAKQVADGLWITWPLEDLIAWQECTSLEGTLSESAPEGLLSPEEAVGIAHQVLLKLDEPLSPQAWTGSREPVTLTEELIASLNTRTLLCLGTESGADEWYVWIYDPAWFENLSLDCYLVVIDAASGEIIDLATPGGNG